MNCLARSHPDFNVTLRWLPGHADIHSNEEADKWAKKVAEGIQNNSLLDSLPEYLRYGSLPLSILALKEAHHKTTHAQWERTWHKSPRFNHIHCIDPKILQ
ncbi:hypothetical protein BDR04DRAFT_1007306 [Suillus decipiens]|nr:hypothetical protein BDR04DRAFT_1007306 [Suillus decipiens]